MKIHKKMIDGYKGNITELAYEIGDLHYEELAKFCHALSAKLMNDGYKDISAKRPKLGEALQDASAKMAKVTKEMEYIWEVSKPFMKNEFVTDVYKFPNGEVAVFGCDGQQIPELQGTYSKELHEKIKQHSDDKTNWHGF